MATRKPTIDPVFRYSPLPVREYEVSYDMFYNPRKMKGEEVYAKWNLCWLSYPHENNRYNTINNEEKYNASDLLDFILCIHAYAGDLLMSSYAYYADFLSGQTLGLNRDPDDANVLLELYKKQAENTPITEVMLSLWLMREMGLPVNNLASGANRRLLHEWQTASDNPYASAVFANNKQSLALGVLISQMLNNKAAPAPIMRPVNPITASPHTN